jgi:hypothetical protein
MAGAVALELSERGPKGFRVGFAARGEGELFEDDEALGDFPGGDGAGDEGAGGERGEVGGEDAGELVGTLRMQRGVGVADAGEFF